MTLEYLVKRKAEGRLLFLRVLLIFAYVVLFFALALLILNLSAPVLYIPFLLLDLVFCAMVAYVSWKFVCPEYELVLGGGEINLTLIYGKSFRRRLLSIPINSLSEFGIYDDGAYQKLCSASLQNNYFCVSSLSAPIIYYALFDIDKGRAVLYFEADERAIKYLKQQNSAAARAGNIK